MARLKPNNVSQGKLKSTGYTGEPTGTIEITENGIHNVKQYASASVDVEPNLESKEVTINENTTTLIEPSEGKDGLSSVSVITNVEDQRIRQLLTGTLTTFEDETMTTTRNYAFYNQPNMLSVSLPNATSIGASTFYGASPKYVNLPKVTSTGAYAFYNSLVEEVNLPQLSNPGNACFRSSKLKRISLPSWTIRSNGEFFRDCLDLEFADVRNLNNIQYYVFAYCQKLITAVCNKCTLINNNGFTGTANTVTALKNLIFEGRCTLGAVGSLANTPFASGNSGGTIYTNYNNVSWYPTASNWSALSSNNQYKSIQENLIAIQALGVDLDGYYEIVEEKPASPTTDMVYLIATATPNEYTQHHWNGTSWNDSLPNIRLGGNNGS